MTEERWENAATPKRQLTDENYSNLAKMLGTQEFGEDTRAALQAAAEEFWAADRLTGRPPTSRVKNKLKRIESTVRRSVADLLELCEVDAKTIKSVVGEKGSPIIKGDNAPSDALARYLGPDFLEALPYDLHRLAQQAVDLAESVPAGKSGPDTEHKKTLFTRLIDVMKAAKPPEDQEEWLYRKDRLAYLRLGMQIIVGEERTPPNGELIKWHNAYHKSLDPKRNRRRPEL